MAARYRPPVPARRRRFRFALAVTAIVIAAGAAGAVLARSGSHATAGVRAAASPASGVAPSPAAALAPASPAPADSAPAGPAPAGLASVSPAALAGLRWMDFRGVELPVSPSAGPWHTADGLAWGFAHTPLGALLAAVNIGVRANAQWGPGIFGPTIRDQVTGPDAAALLASCQASYQQASQAAGIPAGQPLGPADAVEEAFRWIVYSPAGATVDIVSASPGAQGGTARAVTRIEVQWSPTGWRVIAPPGGDWGSSATRLTSLTGYTSFVPPA